MNKRLVGLFWGLVLIAAGSYALAIALGYGEMEDPLVWAVVFGGISLVSLIFYLFDGLQQWAWLFPVGVFGGLGIVTGLAAAGATNPAMAAPLFVGIAVPFAAAFVIDRTRHWWALIPMGVMAFLTLAVLATDSPYAEWIGAGLFLLLAISFLLVYLSRRVLWAAIVAYVMLALATIIWLGTSSFPEYAGALLPVAISLPFFITYLTSRERWWAIIPAGILLATGLVTAILLIPAGNDLFSDTRAGNALVLAGVAATFAVVWLREHKHWAMIVTLVTAAAAVGMLLFEKSYIFWPLVTMAAGVYILFRTLRPSHA